MSADPTQTYALWSDGFTPAELDAIEQYGDRLAQEEAGVLERPEDRQRGAIRIGRTARIKRIPDTEWIYDRVQRIAMAVNNQVYQFDLRNFSEEFQYTVYHDSEAGHYDWHIDQGPFAVQRKLSASLQLSDPSQYEGGELQFHAGNKVEVAPRERGAFIAFPAYVLHRVTPVTSGTRKALVIWTTGPKFK